MLAGLAHMFDKQKQANAAHDWWSPGGRARFMRMTGETDWTPELNRALHNVLRRNKNEPRGIVDAAVTATAERLADKRSDRYFAERHRRYLASGPPSHGILWPERDESVGDTVAIVAPRNRFYDEYLQSRNALS